MWIIILDLGQKQHQEGRNSLDNGKISLYWEQRTILNLGTPDEIASNM